MTVKDLLKCDFIEYHKTPVFTITFNGSATVWNLFIANDYYQAWFVQESVVSVSNKLIVTDKYSIVKLVDYLIL